MNTIFDSTIREQLVGRIKQVHLNDKAEWGKMNAFQMLKHNTYWNEWILGKGNHVYKQSLIGRVVGKMVLKNMIIDEKPIDKNIPTSAQFKAKELKGDFESEKSKFISLIYAYENFNNPNFIHDFFGTMTAEQIGVLVYKHTDHHLRQFGA